MNDKLQELYERGITGLDLSPGDPLCKWAYQEIVRLNDKLDRYGLALQQISGFVDPITLCRLPPASMAHEALTNPDFGKEKDEDDQNPQN